MIASIKGDYPGKKSLVLSQWIPAGGSNEALPHSLCLLLIPVEVASTDRGPACVSHLQEFPSNNHWERLLRGIARPTNGRGKGR